MLTDMLVTLTDRGPDSAGIAIYSRPHKGRAKLVVQSANPATDFKGLDNDLATVIGELTRKQLQQGVHRSTAELEADIAAFIEAYNEDPKPYRWLKSADEILASLKRFCQRTQQTLCGEL